MSKAAFCALLFVILCGCSKRVINDKTVEEYKENCKKIGGYFSAVMNEDMTVNRVRCVIGG